MENEELLGNCIHVAEKQTIVSAAGVCKCCGQVERRAVSVNAIPPWNGSIIDEITVIG